MRIMSYIAILVVTSVSFMLGGCEEVDFQMYLDTLKNKDMTHILVVSQTGKNTKAYYEIESDLVKEFISLIEQTTETREGMQCPSVDGGGTEIYMTGIEKRYNYHIFLPPVFEGRGKTPRVSLEKKGAELPTDYQYENTAAFKEYIELKGEKCTAEDASIVMGEWGIFAQDTITYSTWRYWKSDKP